MTVDRELLERLPKAELHVHLDGSLRPETIWELAQEQEVELPADSADGIRRWFTDELPERDLVGYLSRFDVSTSVMQTKEALERIAFELVEDAAAENVWYLEVRYAPILLTKRGLPAAGGRRGSTRARAQGTRRTRGFSRTRSSAGCGTSSPSGR